VQATLAKGEIRPYLERTMSRLTASRAAFDLIASFEGYRTRAVRTPNGQWTLGFGHTATAREGLSVTRAEAEDLLRWDLLPIEDTVRQVALTPLNQSQFDALVSFAFNIGLENFKTSDVLKYLNQGQPVAAALSMHAWRRAPVNGRVLTIDALVRRRAAESAMFLETIGARPAAPTSIIRPQIDYSAALLSHAIETEEPILAANDEDDSSFATGATQEPTQEVNGETHAKDAPEEFREPVISGSSSKSSAAEAITRDVLSDGPVVLPVAPLPPMAPLGQSSSTTSFSTGERGPMVPGGLSPFPGSPVYSPANGSGSTINEPANDSLKTRLHNAPEMVETPASEVPGAIKSLSAGVNNVPILVWGLIALGAALLAFGLYFSWKSGILTVATPRRDPTTTELGALLAAGSGFIILVTSAVSALTGNRDEA
jgi:lysozyme